jgi:hypothetical protein
MTDEESYALHHQRNKISEREMEILVEYLLAKVGQKDWNGVLNIVNDLREMDVRV